LGIDQLIKKCLQRPDSYTIPGYIIPQGRDMYKSQERPTFHEIRSLGIKLYEDAGVDAQALAGHTDRSKGVKSHLLSFS
jgi:hypothetical protein